MFERFYNSECEPKKLGALNLAFVGDSVFDLFVRERLVCSHVESTVNTIHNLSVEQVKCKAQAAAAVKLQPLFTEEEKAIYLRGRNAHPSHLPKNSSPADYHAATALEAVFGYLYLQGKIERLREFFGIVCNTES